MSLFPRLVLTWWTKILWLQNDYSDFCFSDFCQAGEKWDARMMMMIFVSLKMFFLFFTLFFSEFWKDETRMIMVIVILSVFARWERHKMKKRKTEITWVILDSLKNFLHDETKTEITWVILNSWKNFLNEDTKKPKSPEKN